MPFRAPSSPFFPMFFRGWNRLEPRSRRDDFGFGLAAPIADPLWALGRQVQMQELHGEDAGTAIRTDVTYQVRHLAEIGLGEQPFENIGSTPVEVHVEREAIAWDWRLRVRAGQHFERLGRAHDVATLDRVRPDCLLQKPEDEIEWAATDYASRRFVMLMAGRAIDGEKVFGMIDRGDIGPPLAGLMQGWYDSLYSRGPGLASPAWKPERLDYQFRLRGTDAEPGGVLRARSTRNGSIDWHSFVADRRAVTNFGEPALLHATPVRVTFAGQPKARWWEFEDAAVSFGALDVAKTDLAKTIFISFALQAADDWLLVPLQAVEPNTLIRVANTIGVLDCFGVRTPINRARDPSSEPWRRWQAYLLAPGKGTSETADLLYVPPSGGGREESPVLEEIQFARDEDANVVFAIEHIVPNDLGEPARGFAAHLEEQRRWREHLGTDQSEETPQAPSETAAADSEPPPPRPKIRYVLSTKVPRNWIPFIATDEQNVVNGLPRRSVKLRQAEIVSTEAADEQRRISSLSRLLSPTQGEGVEWINEEAVGRAGVRVELRRQRVRSATGETYVWLGRKIGIGKGEARSGLRFDAVIP
jgi:hypothetical protein